MKRPTKKLWERQQRLARYRYEEKVRRKGDRRSIPGTKYVSPGEVVQAPVSFNLVRGSGREVAKFLRAVATSVLKNNQPVKLDFSRTEQFFVPGTILLFAELDRIVTLSNLPKPITIIDPTLQRPREVLKQIGIYELTGDHREIVPQREDVVYWKATKGNTQSGDTYGSLVEAIAERANRDHAKKLELSGLWRSVNEAVVNSIDHAYDLPRFDAFRGLETTKWWMFSQIKDNTFTLAVCDLGCGYRRTINKSIPEQFIAGFASTFFGSNLDSRAIDTAMAYGRSGTKQSHRGKGSRDALSLLKTHGDGELVILSNSGWMRYEYRSGKEKNKVAGDLGIDIGGTIVWWKLPLKELPHETN